MKKLVIVAALSLASAAWAQVSCQTIGSFTTCSDGSSAQQIGNFTFGNDGSSAQRIGGTTFFNPAPPTYAPLPPMQPMYTPPLIQPIAPIQPIQPIQPFGMPPPPCFGLYCR